MLVLFFILGVISFLGSRFAAFHDDYVGRAQTTAIKGIFSLLIVFSHMNSYLHMTSAWDRLYVYLINLVDQLMVTMFLFYSGYGVLESYRTKSDYVNTFFRKRFFKVLLHFDLAVGLFAVLNLILGISYPLKEYLLCWTAWGSIGNSNWFIFDTLVFYLLTLFCMQFCRKVKAGEKVLCTMVTVLCLIFWYGLKSIRGTERWWYDTIFCYPAGMWYSTFKRRIDSVARKTFVWVIGLLLLLGSFVFLYMRGDVVSYSICAAVFCVLVVWITMKVKLDNPVLQWLGVHSFSIYILQRLPMIVLAHFGWNDEPLLFSVLSIAVILPLAAGFTRLLNAVDRQLFF